MNIEESGDKVIETDVLVVGGGLAGCVAAIKAREHNVKVTLIDKANIRRSGRGGGMDHYPAIAHPRINGPEAEEYGRIRIEALAGLASTKLSVKTSQNILKPLVLLEDIGVTVREYDDTFVMQGGRLGLFNKILPRVSDEFKEKAQTFRGDFLFYRGADVKIKLAAECYKKGVDVLNRTMLHSLITKDGSVVGATVVNVRTGQFIVIKAKKTIITTGSANRLYSYQHAPFPLNLFVQFNSPLAEGAGIAAAYKAGAPVTNMEYHYMHVNPGGLPFWAQSILGSPYLNSKGEELREKYPIAKRIPEGGRVPEAFYMAAHQLMSPDVPNAEVYRDVPMFHPDGIAEGSEWMWNRVFANGDPIMFHALRARGGMRKGPMEVRVWLDGLARSLAGIMLNERGETSLKGLFVAGDVMGGMPLYGSSGAFTWGYLCGNNAAEDAAKIEIPVFDTVQEKQVQSERERALAPLKRKESANPMDNVTPLELEDIVRRIMWDYVGFRKIEPRLKRALELLKLIKEKYVPALKARDAHELMRALEVQHIIQVAELHAMSSLIRTETRISPNHYRVDYPERDEANWRKSVVLKNVGGKIEHTLQAFE